MARSILAALAALSLGAFFVDHPAAHWVFALSAATFPVALIRIGSGRDFGGRLGWPLISLWAILAVGLSSILLLAGPESPRVGPMPVSGMVLLGLIWLLPLILTTVSYVRTFDESGLTPESIRKIKEAARTHSQNDGGASRSRDARENL